MSSHPLDMIRCNIQSMEDAVRWACILEATAPKPGNVHPSARFKDLSYHDFILSAEYLGRYLCHADLTFGERIYQATQATYQATRTNVNLGIALLLTPLVMASEKENQMKSVGSFSTQIRATLQSITLTDSRRVFQAIAESRPGGLNLDANETASLKMDVQKNESNHDDLMKAMRLSADRDQIAHEYEGEFQYSLQRVAPLIDGEIQSAGDILQGLVHAFVVLLSEQPDSLIVRKNGHRIASQVQKRAQQVDLSNNYSIFEFDQSLRRNKNWLNPGTTADLIVAGLFLLLRPSS